MIETRIAIAGMPRSGTSWLGQIFDSSPDVVYRFQPFFAYAFKHRVDMDSTRAEFEQLFEDMSRVEDEFLTQSDKRAAGVYPSFAKSEDPRFLVFKTCRYQYLLIRLLAMFDDLKVVGIVRHPCGSLNSWLQNPKEMPPDADPKAEWRFAPSRNVSPEEFFGFYKWKEVAHTYLDLQQKYPRQFFLVRYEDLVDQPLAVTRAMFEFAGVPLTDSTREFLAACHQRHDDNPYSVFKDKTVRDRWREELDPDIQSEVCDDLSGTRLELFL